MVNLKMQETSIKCPLCGKYNLEGATECKNCGSDISHLRLEKTTDRMPRSGLVKAIIEDKLADVGGENSIALQVPPEMSVREVVQQMVENKKCSVVVVGSSGSLEGIFTERSLVLRVANESPLNVDKPVKDAMLNKPIILDINDSVAHALHHMNLGGYTYAIIDDDPVRVVNIRDILNYLVTHPSHDGF